MLYAKRTLMLILVVCGVTVMNTIIERLAETDIWVEKVGKYASATVYV